MSKICFVNDADRDAFRVLVENNTSSAEGVRNLEAALKLVDIDSHGDTKCDGKINSTEWELFSRCVNDYVRSRRGSKFTFGQLEGELTALLDHQ
ncbi:MAG: hypothetical protein AAF658_15900, partial [Myxococcota bacterium]